METRPTHSDGRSFLIYTRFSSEVWAEHCLDTKLDVPV